MATEVKLPQLGQTMEEGTIVNWLVKVDDEVKKGQVLCEVETDKATLEMESPAEGFVKQLAVKAGTTVSVGQLIVILGGKDEDVAAAPTPATEEQAPATAQTPAAADSPAAQAAPAGGAAVSAGSLPADFQAVKLPQLGQTMEEGTIVNWLVKDGDEVKKGQVLCEVETDKATLEMESPAEGFVKALIAETGQTVPVGNEIIVLGPKDKDLPEGALVSQQAPSSAPQPAPTETQTQPAAAPASKAPASSSKKVKASPRAKKLAKQLGVDLSVVTGSGPGGRITEDDVKNASHGAPAKGGEAVVPHADVKLGDVVKVNRLQKITAEKMLKSKHEIPCFYLNVQVDMTDLVGFRAKLNETSDVKVSFHDFLLKAVAIALEKFPIMTGQLDGDVIRLADSINIGLAISVPDGLVAPIVKDLNKKDVKQIARDSKALIEKARNNRLAPTDLEGGCTTISNLGSFGVESFIPVVVPGQTTILGVGQIKEVCVPEVRKIEIRKMMNLTLSVDHKVANGAYAAEFLDFVRKNLENTDTFS